MTNIPSLEVSQIQDQYTRENFRKLLDFLRNESPLLGFRFFEMTFTAAVTSQKIPHGLGYQPKDIIQTSLTGSGAVTWNYTNFTANELDITTTGACVVRFFAGTYVKGAV